MSKADRVYAQIQAHHGASQMNHADLAAAIRNDRIAPGVDAVESSAGYDVSFDESLMVSEYDDGSVLVVGYGTLKAYG